MLSHINVGSGTDVTIRELAETVARVTGFTGDLVFDSSKPDGTPRKLMDVTRLERLGWRAKIPLEQGIRETYAWFLAQDPDGCAPNKRPGPPFPSCKEGRLSGDPRPSANSSFPKTRFARDMRTD